MFLHVLSYSTAAVCILLGLFHISQANRMFICFTYGNVAAYIANIFCLSVVQMFVFYQVLPNRPAPMAHSYRLGLVTWGYQVRIPVGTDICHRGCAYTVLQTVQRHGVYSAAYGTVHYKEPLKSFEIRVGHSLGFWLPSVAILP